MKIIRILTVCLILLLVFCELIVSAANTENNYAPSASVSTNGPIIIDDNADLEAFGLNGTVVTGEEIQEENARLDTKYQNEEKSTLPAETPTAISPNVPNESTKAAEKHFGDCIDADEGFGTENNVNSTSESNITENRTWYIWGSCRVDHTINVYPGKTLTIFIAKRKVISGSYGNNAVARIIRGGDLTGSAPLFRVYRGAKLYIYGCTEKNKDSADIESYSEYYHLQITNSDKTGCGAIVDFVNDTSEGGSSSTADATFVCKRVTFRNSHKSGPGAGIVVNAPLAKFDLKWCGFRNLDATYGGAIHISDSCTSWIDDVVLKGCLFDDCNATQSGGAIYIEKGVYKDSDGIHGDRIKFKKFTLTGTEFSKCTAAKSGGAICISGASDNPGDEELYGTKIGTNEGGGLYLNQCKFSECKADKDGGAILFEARTTLINLDGATFNKCEAAGGGSAIYLGAGAVINSLVANGATFSNNKACTGSTNYGGTFRTVGNAAVNATFTNCSFYSNTSMDGAAIYWNSGRVYNGTTYIVAAPSLTLNGCTVRNNTASRNGGGIYNEAKLSLKNTDIYSNKAAYGGGISMRNYSNVNGQLPKSLSLELDSTTNIYSNTATSNGAGIHFEIRDTAMESQAPANGGKIDYKLVLNGAKIYSNTATGNGGGVCFESLTGADKFFVFDVELNSGEIYSNKATNGGGIYATSVDHDLGIIINGGVIGGSGKANTATNNGGGVYIHSAQIAMKMNNGSIAYNTATNNGGGIYVNAGTAEFTGGILSNNTANNGGGVFIAGVGAVTMNPVTDASGNITSYATVTQNEANASGGGVYVSGASIFNINEGIISRNKAKSNNGGGIAMSSGTINVRGGNFYNNEALNNNGGAIMAAGASSKVSIIGGIIGSVNNIELANKAGRGGGVYVHNGATLEISNGCIGYNKAVYIYTDGVQNTATAIGGGIATLNSNASITGGIVIGNQAENRGGGIYVYSENQTEKMTFSDGSIGVDEAGNPASNIANYGGGVYVNNALFEMTRSGDVSGSITNNIALVNGGGLYVVSAPATIAGDISNNTAANNGGGVYLEGASISFTGNIFDNKAGYNGDTPIEGQGNGGGIYVTSDYTDDTNVKEATINGTISGNYANLNGGGVYAKDGAVVNISGGDIHSNNATNGNGGGVYATEANTYIEIKGGHIGLEDMPNMAINGGGVYIDGARFILDKTESSEGSIGYNIALADGGGGYFYNTTVQIKGNINDNISKGNGGGIYLTNATVTVEGDIINNYSTSSQQLRATVGNGGGAYLVNSSVLNMGTNGNITYNTTDGNGGGIAAYTGSTVNLGGGVISHNMANYGSGGGVYADGSLVEITGSDISENNALNGGGVAAFNDSAINLGGGLITLNTANDGFGGGVFSNNSVVEITGSDICYNSAKNGGGVCVTKGGNLIMYGGLLRYNNAVGVPDDTVTTAFHLDETLAGVGGGVYLSNGVEAELSTYELTGTDNKFGIYGNLADFAADDVFANGVNTQLTLPKASSMTLTGTEFERATGWFEDYVNDDSMYTSGLNGNSVIGGKRYRTTDRTVVAYVNAEDAEAGANDTRVYINTANTYVCLTLGVSKAGLGEITIQKSGENIDPDQVFVFLVSGRATESGQLIEVKLTIKGEGSVTIVDIPDGEYTITELTNWAWRYELADIIVSNGSIDIAGRSGMVSIGESDAAPKVKFINRKTVTKWLNYNSDVVKNVAEIPNQDGTNTVIYTIVSDLPKKKQL